MQSTVFDFTFRLREREKEIYISRGTNLIMSQGFKMILVSNHPKSFSIRSAVGEEGAGQEEATSFFIEKGSSYNRGIGLYDSLFILSAGEGFNYSPRVLIRRTLYHDVLIGRQISDKGFISVDKLVLLRRSVLGPRIHPRHRIKLIKHHNEVLSEFLSISPHLISAWESYSPMKITADGSLISLRRTSYHRIIGTKTAAVVKFSEKVRLKGMRSKSISVSMIYPKSDFNEFRSPYFVEFKEIGSRASINAARYKYAIISLEKNIIKTRGLRSAPSRFIIKG